MRCVTSLLIRKISHPLVLSSLAASGFAGCLPDSQLTDPELPREFSQVVPEVRPRGDAMPPPLPNDLGVDIGRPDLDPAGDMLQPDVGVDALFPDLGPPTLRTQSLYFIGDPSQRSSVGPATAYGHFSWWGSSNESDN